MYTKPLVVFAGAQHRNGDYLVIDINYFPGYEKLPGYESMMVDFLRTLRADPGHGRDGSFGCASRLKHAVSQTPVRSPGSPKLAVPV